jgi:hypothetical protein
MSLPPVHPALVAFAHRLRRALVRGRCGVKADGACESLRHVGLWSLLAALLSGIAAIAAGYWDMNRAGLSSGDTRNTSTSI